MNTQFYKVRFDGWAAKYLSQDSNCQTDAKGSPRIENPISPNITSNVLEVCHLQDVPSVIEDTSTEIINATLESSMNCSFCIEDTHDCTLMSNISITNKPNETSVTDDDSSISLF